MNNATNLAIAAIILTAATLVVRATLSTTATPSAAFAFQNKKGETEEVRTATQLPPRNAKTRDQQADLIPH
jgi:hypothetical protein